MLVSANESFFLIHVPYTLTSHSSVTTLGISYFSGYLTVRCKTCT